MILIGNLEINKNDKIGKMLIAVPFWNKSEFYISLNKKKETEHQPDYLIWHSKIAIGALWKGKYTKEGIEKNYMSGSIKVINPDINNLLKIACFESVSANNSFWTANVFWSDEERKAVDEQLEYERNIQNENSEDAGEIF
jgi:uncharacterized protein (DUF736 family)